MAKGKILKSLVKKKPSGIKKSTPRYVKTASGMKLNPERFKQKPLPKTKRLVSSPKKEALKDTAAIAGAGKEDTAVAAAAATPAFFMKSRLLKFFFICPPEII